MKLSLKSLAALCLLAPATAFATVESGKPAPDFTAQTVTGERFTLSAQKGSPVVLEWSNHQCPFVRKYYHDGDMQKLQETYTAKGVKWIRVLSSAPGKEGHVTTEQAQKIIADQGIKATATLLDESGEIGHLYGAKTTPHIFVINKNGILAYQGAIDSIASADPADIDKAENYAASALDALLSGSQIKTSATAPYGCAVKY